jgi:hypothetical protein
MKLTHDRLKALVDYNPDTGIFTRLIATSPNTKVGEKVGTRHRTGYEYAMLDYETFATHRLAWFYVYGVMPTYDIDHINGDKTNNRISNLRDVKFKTNMQNEVKARKTNKSGYLGVHWRKERCKWVAQLMVNGKHKRFGSFDTPEQAYKAYLEAKRKYHDGCTI